MSFHETQKEDSSGFEPENSSNKNLTDQYGRIIRKLRISVIDACNFRCFYCMPENAKFQSPKTRLSPQRIFEVAKILVEQGIEQIRLTGGEPTMRRELPEILSLLGQLEIPKFGITSNGFTIHRFLDRLQAVGCIHLNISLDSLQPQKFAEITRTNCFEKVFSNILDAKERGFNVKLNTILMRGQNDDEILDFLDFSAKYQIPVRFLELMQIGEVCKQPSSLLVSADEAIARIKTKHQLNPIRSDRDATAFSFATDHGAEVGFIASETKPFCGTCSRWRLSADGMLRACLMSKSGISIADITDEELRTSLPKLFPMKPYHRIEKLDQNMNQIGG